MIRVQGLGKRFGDLEVLKGIDVHIQRGECVAIIGRSGSGKSMFLRSIAMLEKPDTGSVFINGEEITRKGADLNRIREKMGMVYQGFHLFSHLNVQDNVALAPRWVKRLDKAAAESKALELLAMVGMAEKVKSYPRQLSGGQQQRVAIARCLAMDPEIMLLDEPTSALDPAMTNEVLSIVKKLVGMGLTMLIVTHEMSFAKEVASRVLFIEDGEIYEDGVPSVIFENPRREKTRAFIARLNMLNYEIRSASYDSVAMNAKIEVFCNSYGVSRQKTYTLQLVLEELIMMIIKQCYAAIDPDIELSIAYNKEADEITIYFYYKAAAFNPFELHRGDLDNLGIVLIDNYVKKHEHVYDGLRNRILITL